MSARKSFTLRVEDVTSIPTPVMLRDNQGKPQFSYLPNSFLMALPPSVSRSFVTAVTRVLEFGAIKYSPDNWRKSGSWRKATDSALRHLIWALEGEIIDPESGLTHMAHLGCNLAFLIEFDLYHLGVDDRYRRGSPHRNLYDEPQESPLLEMLGLLSQWLEGGELELLEQCLATLCNSYEELTK